MFKFDRSIPFNKLIGQTVECVLFSTVGVRINFYDDYISIDHLHGFAEDNLKNVKYFQNDIIELVGKDIIFEKLINENHFLLKFSNNYVLNFFESGEYFEKYDFFIGGNNFIV